MVPAIGLVNLGGSTEFGSHHDQRAVKQTSFVQIGNERGKSFVQIRAVFLKSLFNVGMHVPAAVGH